MGQQHRKHTKRRRRTAYIKRQKEIRKNSGLAASVPLAKKIVQPAEPVAETAEVVTPAEAAPAKKAPAKSTAKNAAEAPAEAAPAEA